MTEQIVILDFGSQYTQVIARRVRECNVYSVILRYDTPAREIARLNPKGLILSGGPSSVYAKNAPLPDRAIFKLGIPVLGICYGLQLLAQYLGGKVEPGQKREYGKGTLRVKDRRCPLFANLPKTLQVWNSHGDKLTRLPAGFKAGRRHRELRLRRHREPRRQDVRLAVPPRGGPHAARARDPRQLRPRRLRLRQELDDAQLH